MGKSFRIMESQAFYQNAAAHDRQAGERVRYTFPVERTALAVCVPEELNGLRTVWMKTVLQYYASFDQCANMHTFNVVESSLTRWFCSLLRCALVNPFII